MLKHLSKGDWVSIGISLVLAICFGTALQSFLDMTSPLDNQQEIVYAVLIMWFSYTFGAEIFATVLSSVRRKKIQREMDMERSFKKLSGEDIY